VTTEPLSAWRTRWFFVCPADLLDEDQSHVTIDLPELSVTIQNFRGLLAGFWNVCSHRAAEMRPAGYGQGLLRCPYHGWTYNGDGVPVGIPENEALFGLDAEAKRKLALKPIRVMLVAGGIFARIEDDGSVPEIGELAEVGLAGMALRQKIERRLAIGQPPAAPGNTIGNLSVLCGGDFAVIGWVVPDGAGGVRATIALYGDEAIEGEAPEETRMLYDAAASALIESAGG
jgi:nitrite reductase/ring-hydroxylating ferredoxin subunit